ncbi:alpha-ribazole phosphatase [Oscillatoria amoena NRMC-F 0135]|nr:alpha-ribazole phosphatase [Oscillatoria amoena NRMC-F 0135]
MRLLLIRHTRVQIAPGICYGQSDVPLAETFEEEAKAVAGKLPPAWDKATVYSSPSTRCVRLAAQIAPACRTDARLMELNFGSWELTPWDEIDRVESEFWMADYVHRACPGGESYSQMAGRVRQFAGQIARETPGQAILVTHAGVIRIFYCLAEGKPLTQAFDLNVGHGEIFAVDSDGQTFTKFHRLSRLLPGEITPGGTVHSTEKTPDARSKSE